MKRAIPLVLILLNGMSPSVSAKRPWELQNSLYSNPYAFTTAPTVVILKERRKNFSGFYSLNERVNYIYAAFSGSKREDIFVSYSYRVTPDGTVKDLHIAERHCPDDYERLARRALKMVFDSYGFEETLKHSPAYLGERNFSFRYAASQIPRIPKQKLSDEKLSQLLEMPLSDWVLQRLAPMLFEEKMQPGTRARWLYRVLACIPEADRFPKTIEKVVCKLKLESNGAVKDVVVSKSSGDANCDSEAIAFLKKYQPYPTPLNAELLNAGLVVYFDGDMGLTVQVDDGKSEPPHIFYK